MCDGVHSTGHPDSSHVGCLNILCTTRIQVTVRALNNKPYVDVREFYEKNGELMPGKKGNPAFPNTARLARHFWGI